MYHQLRYTCIMFFFFPHFSSLSPSLSRLFSLHPLPNFHPSLPPLHSLISYHHLSSIPFHFIICYPLQSWDVFFTKAHNGAAPGEAYIPPPPLASMYPSQARPTVAAPSHPSPSVTTTQVPAPSPSTSVMGQLDRKVIEDHLSVQTINQVVSGQSE